MGKGIIYYTDNRARIEHFYPIVQAQILLANLPIVSVSLKYPIDFGKNIFLRAKYGYTTMIRQIILALENSEEEYIFFCEHDVLYHPSHFEFTPPTNYIYYYNVNNWKWIYPNDLLVTYDGLHSLSMLCCSRELALNHFRYRLSFVENNFRCDFGNAEPRYGQQIAFEPGTKKVAKGGVTDEDFDVWRSKYPNIDIRYRKNFTRKNVDFYDLDNRAPGWKQTTFDSLEGWSNVRERFGL